MKKLILGLLAVLLAAPLAAQTAHVTLLSQTITTAGTVVGAVTPFAKLPHDAARYLAVQAVFTYGSGGTSAKAYVQTSLDGGTTWVDVASLAFTTATATKVSAVSTSVALAAGVAPTDGTLTDNTILNGLVGDRVRVKLISVGTYAGSTTLVVTAVAR